MPTSLSSTSTSALRAIACGVGGEESWLAWIFQLSHRVPAMRGVISFARKWESVEKGPLNSTAEGVPNYREHCTVIPIKQVRPPIRNWPRTDSVSDTSTGRSYSMDNAST